MAAVTPLGNSLDDIRAAIAAGKSGISQADESLKMRFVGSASRFAGKIGDFGELPKDRTKAIRKALKLMCRETQMAVAAAQLALADAKLSDENRTPERAGIVLGSDYMLTMPEDYVDGIRKCTGANEQFEFAQWGDDGLSQMTPLWMLKYLPNMPASHIAIFNDLRGPNNSLTMREASSVMAIGEAFRTVARGHADVMLCGATGTRILPMQAIHAKQTEQLASGDDPATACRPFERRRTGMVGGEGAGVLVLEELSSAKARGATLYGEVIGHGSSLVADAALAGRNRMALTNAMQAALRDAQVDAGKIGHINAHGLATHDDDIDEAQAIADVFGDAAGAVPVTAMKSYFGNLGAGSGTAELIASLLGFSAGRIPATLNYDEPDPDCPLNVAKSTDVPAGDSMLKLNVTPQGQAAAVVVRRL